MTDLNIKLFLDFDGTNYSGWQIQANAITIQEVIETCLKKIYNKKINVYACGRTDAGVHAKNFIINFKIPCLKIPVSNIPKALNAYLPFDICATKAIIVKNSFHATYNVKKKTYRYTILNCRYNDVFNRNFYFQFKKTLDTDKMIKASKLFIGKHDFRAFCSEANKKTNCIRTILDLKIKKQKDFILIDITSDGFLYNMVRIITGTLLEAGKGKLSTSEIKDIFKTNNRNNAGPTAPAKGLQLLKVYY
jgi:tRNA pseudouridine38-40 synthase